MDRLRGNTFLLLLLRAGNDTLLTPQEYGDSKSGVTRPNMLADLIRISDPSYNPAKITTLASYFSVYLQGMPKNSPGYLPFHMPSCQYGLETRIKDDYHAVLRQMDAFCHTYLTNDEIKLRRLVGGLVDIILSDDSFSGEFDVGNKWVGKNELGTINAFQLQSFLVSVWNIILRDHPNHTEGAETYRAWTENAGFNTAANITTDIGAMRAKKIVVSTELPEMDAPSDTADDIPDPVSLDDTMDQSYCDYNQQTETPEAEVIDSDYKQDDPTEHNKHTNQPQVINQTVNNWYNAEGGIQAAHIENLVLPPNWGKK